MPRKRKIRTKRRSSRWGRTGVGGGSRAAYAWPCSVLWHGLPCEDTGGALEPTWGASGCGWAPCDQLEEVWLGLGARCWDPRVGRCGRHASGFLCGKLLCSCEHIPHSFSGMFGRRMWRKRKLSRPGCRAVRTESLVGPASGLRLGVLDGLRTSRVHPTAESWGAVHSLPGGGKGWGKHRGDQAGVFLSVFHPPNGKEKRHMGPRYERSVEKTSCGFRGVGRKLPTIHSRNDP